MKLSVESEMRRAKSHVKRGEIAEAAQVYEGVLLAFPKNKRAQQELEKLKTAPANGNPRTAPANSNMPRDKYEQLVARFRQGTFSDVVRDGERLAAEYPNDFILQFMLGASYASLNRPDEAVAHYKRGLELKPDYAEGHYNFGNVLEDKGALDEAEASYEQAIRINPDYAEAHYNLGVVQQKMGALGRAEASYNRALKLNPNNATARNNLGSVFELGGAYDDAAAQYARAIRLRPDYAEAHVNLGNILQRRGELDDAMASYTRAVDINPDYPEAHYNLGLVLQDKGALDEAIASFTRAIELKPDHREAHNNLGAVLGKKGNLDESITSYLRAIEIDAAYAEAHNNLGNTLRRKDEIDEAVACYKRALEINPLFAEAHYNLGAALKEKSALGESVELYAQALEINPDFSVARMHKLHQQAQMCDWSAVEQDAAYIPKLGIEGASASPFTMLVMDDSPERNLLRSVKYSKEKNTRTALPPIPRPNAKPRRLRVGYFSADFHGHATMHLIAKLFEVHDRDQFEIYAYSYGPDKQDEFRQRLVNAVDVFHDVRDMSDDAVAELARAEEIDIAVDLKGHTEHARSAIFAYRAAPVQIAYLGYPGTTGAPFIDYIIADETVIPESLQRHYSENVIYLPDSYQVNDDSRLISIWPMTRSEFGLPEDGFVFCCFNSNYKITPDEFDVWMRLLSKTEGSVLWLLKSNEWVEERLRAEAEARNVDGARIIFAERLPFDQHLARCRLADLFLDTFVCNAHTTASDALWTGLPLVTKLGQGFAARVGGSLLKAIGLPELITETEADYEALALDLAANPQKLAEIRQKLADNRATKPLFDTDRFARHIEDAYSQAYQRYFDGMEPCTLKVQPATAIKSDETKIGDDLKDKVGQLLALFNQGKLAEIVADTEKLVSENPENPLLHNFLGVVNEGLSKRDEAGANYRRALEIKPDYAEAYYNLGNVFREAGALDEAAASYGRALELSPDHADGHYNLGNVLQSKGERDKAVECYCRALEIDPDHSKAREQKLHQLSHMCDWTALEDDHEFVAKLGIEGAVVSPFSMLAMEDDPARHRLRSERIWGTPLPALARRDDKPERLRVGYFSADFHDHATMYLMAGLFALHDRKDFEIHAYSYGPDKQDGMRRHLVDNVDGFHDVRELNDEAVARLAREDHIDIAVDLKGYTQHSRVGIFACRAAPVQISYLGYPGTSGAPFMDYLIADEMVVPPAQRQHYSENLIYMPDSYQVNDNTRKIATREMTRAEFGLPEDAFVFCCFNSNYKIGSDEFEIWMRLLNQIEGSVLWLLKTNPWAEANLREYAEARGVSGERIVFAERLPQDEHLARYRLADLFLDTFKYNAHTTASDALWAGLPLVTKLGQGFAARVGGSLLNAVGLAELITHSNEDYEKLALELGRDRDKLASVKQKLAQNKTSEPLFDTEAFVRHLEQAYRRIYQSYFDGIPPTSINVGP